MRKIFIAAAAFAAAMLPVAANAQPVPAGKYQYFSATNFLVSGSYGFGNNDPVVYPPHFSDTYDFRTAFARTVTVDITSTMASLGALPCLDNSRRGCDFSTNVNFISNGVKLDATVIPVRTSGVNEERYLANFRLPAGTHQILVRGSSGENGTYAGLLALSGVPEPATWALMIMGFGLTGASLRRRQGAARAAIA